jgi:hypothetical protein
MFTTNTRIFKDRKIYLNLTLDKLGKGITKRNITLTPEQVMLLLSLSYELSIFVLKFIKNWLIVHYSQPLPLQPVDMGLQPLDMGEIFDDIEKLKMLASSDMGVTDMSSSAINTTDQQHSTESINTTDEQHNTESINTTDEQHNTDTEELPPLPELDVIDVRNDINNNNSTFSISEGKQEVAVHSHISNHEAVTNQTQDAQHAQEEEATQASSVNTQPYIFRDYTVESDMAGSYRRDYQINKIFTDNPAFDLVYWEIFDPTNFKYIDWCLQNKPKLNQAYVNLWRETYNYSIYAKFLEQCSNVSENQLNDILNGIVTEIDKKHLGYFKNVDFTSGVQFYPIFEIALHSVEQTFKDMGEIQAVLPKNSPPTRFLPYSTDFIEYVDIICKSDK